MDKLSLVRDGFGRAADVQVRVIFSELNYRLNDGCSQVIAVALFPQRSTSCHRLNVPHWNACKPSLEASHSFVAELGSGGLNCDMMVTVSRQLTRRVGLFQPHTGWGYSEPERTFPSEVTVHP